MIDGHNDTMARGTKLVLHNRYECRNEEESLAKTVIARRNGRLHINHAKTVYIGGTRGIWQPQRGILENREYEI